MMFVLLNGCLCENSRLTCLCLIQHSYRFEKVTEREKEGVGERKFKFQIVRFFKQANWRQMDRRSRKDIGAT